MAQFLQENWPLAVFAVGFVVIISLAMFSLRQGPLPYERRGVLLSPAESNFLRVLYAAAREDWLVFAMVRLADVIKVRSKTRQSAAWTTKIAGKHIDFVLCDPETLEVKLAIELDDPAALTPEKRERNRFVTTALSASGLPLLRIRAEEKYETAALRKDVEDALGIQRKKKRS